MPTQRGERPTDDVLAVALEGTPGEEARRAQQHISDWVEGGGDLTTALTLWGPGLVRPASSPAQS